MRAGAQPMADGTVDEAVMTGADTAGGGPGAPPRWGRRVAAILVVVVVGAVVASFVLQRRRPAGPPGWVPAAREAAAAEQIEANVQRLLAREATELGAMAERAGRLPELAALVTSSIDGAAFQDALSSEPWWKRFRGYGCAVLVGDEVKAVWQLPGSGLPPGELVRAVSAGPAVPARVVSGPNAAVLGAMAPIAGVKDARVLLADLLDRRKVALLAARANVVLMLTDGRKDLGASVPDDIVPQLEGLVGHEASHVMVERHLSQLAVAVPWTSGLWLWVITPEE